MAKPADPPPYASVVADAIKGLGGKKGSSRQAIGVDAAKTEHLAARVLELAGDAARDIKNTRIGPNQSALLRASKIINKIFNFGI